MKRTWPNSHRRSPQFPPKSVWSASHFLTPSLNPAWDLTEIKMWTGFIVYMVWKKGQRDNEHCGMVFIVCLFVLSICDWFLKNNKDFMWFHFLLFALWNRCVLSLLLIFYKIINLFIIFAFHTNHRNKAKQNEKLITF